MRLLVLLFISVVLSSCGTIRYVTKVETVYRYPAKVTHPSLPRLTIYDKEETVFTKDTYRALLKEYSAFVVFTKQLLMIVKKHNAVIAEIKKEEDAAEALLKTKEEEKTDAI